MKGVTLEVTEVFSSALYAYGAMGVLRPVTGCRLRGDNAGLYDQVFANDHCRSIMLAIADTQLQLHGGINEAVQNPRRLDACRRYG